MGKDLCMGVWWAEIHREVRMLQEVILFTVSEDTHISLIRSVFLALSPERRAEWTTG